MSSTAPPPLPTRLVAFVKRDCPTCELVAPVLAELATTCDLTVYTQDDPAFPAGVTVEDDTQLDFSYRHNIEVVPTLIRASDGREEERVEGWHRGDWQKISEQVELGRELPELRPGCGSLTLDPERADELLEDVVVGHRFFFVGGPSTGRVLSVPGRGRRG